MTMQSLESKNTVLPLFKFKGSTVTMTTLQLLDNDLSHFPAQIEQAVSTAPKFFNDTPVIIDCQIIADKSGLLDLPFLVDTLRQHHMIPIGLRGGRSDVQYLATNVCGLPLFPPSKTEDLKPHNHETSIQSSTETPHLSTKIIHQPIRSGQQVYAKGTDLIILGAVSAGAECLADGNIHIYGPLRGRALAGIMGDTSAHIFCRHLEAELVSIAGHYQVSETLKEGTWATAADVFLERDNLQVNCL